MYRNHNFGSNLRQFRKKNGLTRAQLAQMLSYSEKAVEKWETNGSAPPVTTICKLADFFQISIDTLLYEEQIPIRYLLGIVVGGICTEFLLTDLSGNALGQITLGASSPVDVGVENSKKILQEGIQQVCTGIDPREVSVYVVLSSSVTDDNQEAIKRFLKKQSFGIVAGGSDLDAALQICLQGSDGIGVIMSIGVVAFTQQNGEKKQIAGWGYLLDKGGSGYNLGADALDSALRYIDGRGGSELLLQMIEQRLQKPLLDSITLIYNGGQKRIASFAPLVFEAFEQGDKEAERILRRNVQEICQIISTGCARFSYFPKVAICGDLVEYVDTLKPFLVEYLNKKIQLEFITEPFINGAITLARRNIKTEK